MSSDPYISERLPWYLNRTLDAAEMAEVEKRLEESEEERDELAATEAAARIFGHRLPVEVLVAYVFDGGHPDVPNELLERYLAVSPVAREELELVRQSKDALERQPGRGDALPLQPVAAPTAASGWRRLALAASIVGVAGLGLALWQLGEARQSERRLAEVQRELSEALAAEGPAPADSELRRRLERLEEEKSRLAAGKGDLVDQIERQEERLEQMGEQIAELTEPLVNVPVVDVWPGDMVLRGESQEDRVVVVPRQTRTVALILNSNVDTEQEVTGLTIRDGEGSAVWRSEVEPRRDELGTFTVALPVQRLEAGRYVLELVQEGPGESRVLETYRIEIR